MKPVGHGLTPLSQRSEEEKKEIARLGGIASGVSRRRKRTFKDIFEAILEDKNVDDQNLTNEEAMAFKMIKNALEGSEKAFEIVRDTVGEKPTDKIQHSGTTTLIKDDLSE